jgi:hypothetical protein
MSRLICDPVTEGDYFWVGPREKLGDESKRVTGYNLKGPEFGERDYFRWR